MDEVLDADDTLGSELLLNDSVGGDGDSLSVDLGESSLVDEGSDGREVGLSVGDVRLDKLKHLGGGLGVPGEMAQGRVIEWVSEGIRMEEGEGGRGGGEGKEETEFAATKPTPHRRPKQNDEPDENSVVDLEESEELQDLSRLGGDLVDTSKSDDEENLGLGGNVEVTRSPRLSSKSDLLLLGSRVLLDVLLGPLEDDLALGLLGLGNVAEFRRDTRPKTQPTNQDQTTPPNQPQPNTETKQTTRESQSCSLSGKGKEQEQGSWSREGFGGGAKDPQSRKMVNFRPIVVQD